MHKLQVVITFYAIFLVDMLSEQIKSLKMARNEKYRKVLKTAYSKWHRNQHNGIAFTDIDKIAQCPACAKALFIGDLIFNKDDSYKTKVFFTKSVYLEISRALNIPYFEVVKGIENQRIYKHNLGLPFFKKKLNLLSDKMMN